LSVARRRVKARWHQADRDSLGRDAAARFFSGCRAAASARYRRAPCGTLTFVWRRKGGRCAFR